MALDKKQFRDLIERVLEAVGMNSPAAVNLLLGTAAQESKFGTYIKQIRGPALGVFQCEPATFSDLKLRYSRKQPWISARNADEMEWDLRLAILICRLKYWSIRERLPAADDLEGLAKYWKKYYNTALGKGTEEEFVRNFKKYVASQNMNPRERG